MIRLLWVLMKPNRTLWIAAPLWLAALLVGIKPVARAEPVGDLESLRRALDAARADFTSVKSGVILERRWTDAYDRLMHAPASERATRTISGTWAAEGGAMALVCRGEEGVGLSGSRAAVPNMSYFVSDAGLVRIEESPGARTQDVFVTKKNRVPDNPLEYGYTHRGVWYGDVLKSPGFHLQARETSSDMGPIVVVEGPGQGSSRLMVRFATERGCLAVQAELGEQSPAKRSSRTVWSVLEARKVNGLWLPMAVQRQWYLMENGRDALFEERTIRLLSPEVGVDCAPYLRAPAFRSGALVRDEDEGAYYRVGQGGAMEYVGKMGERAEPWQSLLTPSGWLAVASIGALAAGGACIRRRRSDPL